MSYLSDLLGDVYKDGMTEEEISNALEKMSANFQASKQTNDAEITKLKTALSKANSEAADYKKQLRAKQTADEAAEAERNANIEKLTQENAELRRAMALSETKGKLLGMGYDEKLAESTAAAMVDGNMDVVMENQRKYLEVQRKDILAEKMKKTPRPASGSEGVNNSVEYQKKVEEAQASGDFAAAAYYTRLMSQDIEDAGDKE